MTSIGSFFSIDKAPPQNRKFRGGAPICQKFLIVVRLFRAHKDGRHHHLGSTSGYSGWHSQHIRAVPIRLNTIENPPMRRVNTQGNTMCHEWIIGRHGITKKHGKNLYIGYSKPGMLRNSYVAVCGEGLELRDMAQALSFGKVVSDNGSVCSAPSCAISWRHRGISISSLISGFHLRRPAAIAETSILTSCSGNLNGCVRIAGRSSKET